MLSDGGHVPDWIDGDSMGPYNNFGNGSVIRAGEFQRMSAGPGMRQGERNASLTDGAHLFQIQLSRLQGKSESGLEHKQFRWSEKNCTRRPRCIT